MSVGVLLGLWMCRCRIAMFVHAALPYIHITRPGRCSICIKQWKECSTCGYFKVKVKFEKCMLQQQGECKSVELDQGWGEVRRISLQSMGSRQNLFPLLMCHLLIQLPSNCKVLCCRHGKRCRRPTPQHKHMFARHAAAHNILNL